MELQIAISHKSTMDDDDRRSGVSMSTGSGPSVTTATDVGQERAPDVQLGSDETRWIRYGKALVGTVLLGSALGTGIAAYYLISAVETKDFEAQFKNSAEETIALSNQNAKNIFGLLQIFSTLFASYANKANATWPNYTLPDFEAFSSGARHLSGAIQVAFSPVVTESARGGWEKYSVDNQDWIRESFDFLDIESTMRRPISPFVYRRGLSSRHTEEPGLGAYSPIWQLSPPPTDISIINYNLFNNPSFKRLADFTDFTGVSALSETLGTTEIFGMSPTLSENDPRSILVQPVFQEVGNTSTNIVGHVISVIPHTLYFKNILKEGLEGIYCVLHESYGQSFTFRIDGSAATFVGVGDLHDPKYDSMVKRAEFVSFEGNLTNVPGGQDQCVFTLDIYPSHTLESLSKTNRPAIFTAGVVIVFLFTTIVFVLYDCLVQRRQDKVMATAERTNAIVKSLFPANVREQLYEDAKQEDMPKDPCRVGQSDDNLAVPDDSGHVVDSKPIADLFPEATVFFADIAGFTAWSSVREPKDVFVLLETIYSCFDRIAKSRRVYKVETIGDCYVAVVGLPDPRKSHAVVMCRFARDCLSKMNELTPRLEVQLGPDTGDLEIRVGLHSGPVTAGVLRGDRARFQLFGDTVNTASRMESTGKKGQIQISQETADLLILAGKERWIKPREELIVAKGKGELQTYWLLPKQDLAPSTAHSEISDSSLYGDQPEKLDLDPELAKAAALSPAKSEKIQRMIDWNFDLLLQALQRIIARRKAGPQQPRVDSLDQDLLDQAEESLRGTSYVVSEVLEVIELPEYDGLACDIDARSIDINDVAVEQLHNYVAIIASLYRRNPFHNFEHSGHCMMSAVKLLSRIVAPKISCRTEEEDSDTGSKTQLTRAELHDYTYGITSDPLTQFAVVFSALIHDVDHRGVPNSVLNKEEPMLASVYKYRSVAEQNSVDIAWEVLMEPGFKELRRTIYADESELRRFRSLVVNSVMATDIFDKELSELRKRRWNKAFDDQSASDEVAISRKATIVIEHLIQASDVSHMMQHFDIYAKWNERLYREMHLCYVSGRIAKHPAVDWYEGEIGFFDGYVIPLAKKLKECGVFGVSSDEYLNYARSNRSAWEKKGREIVESFLEKYSLGVDKFDDDSSLVSPSPTSRTPPSSATKTAQRLADAFDCFNETTDMDGSDWDDLCSPDMFFV